MNHPSVEIFFPRDGLVIKLAIDLGVNHIARRFVLHGRNSGPAAGWTSSVRRCL